MILLWITLSIQFYWFCDFANMGKFSEVECDGTAFYTDPEGEHVTGAWAAVDICISIGLILVAGK